MYVHAHTCNTCTCNIRMYMQGCMQEFFQGGANLGYRQKRGVGSLCEVLHPTLARGGGE